ncbi:MAG: acyltransferase domain-containing protein, partial [Planctomycetales bacterium]|nr:acyltransferase domain-containing protein [Planctomycetales bacterium]
AARACQHAGYDPRNLPYRQAGVFVGHSGGSTLGGELAYRTLVEDYLKLLDELPEFIATAERRAALKEFLPTAERWGTWKQRLSELLTADRPQRAAGRPWVEAGFSAALVCRALGLTGPHMAIDAACASSLVALAMGAMSIHSGQTDMAIIGGASFNKTDSLILFSHAQSCSSSMSRPFDERADGLISSEGYVALVIKSLERAQADGDRIQAVLHGIGISTDGRGKSLWAPRKEGQYAAIERAYSAEVLPDSVQMIEAHATSTHLGDATEMEALATFYGKHLPAGKRLPVGSVKSNIGHTLETAGLAGVVKAVLAMQQGVIPPSINVEQLNQSIPWQDIPLSVVRSPEAWPSLPAGQPRRAAVNAFGIGGLNVHVVVEQAAESETRPGNSTTRSVEPHSMAKHSMAEPSVGFEPIAIIGRGLVLPGTLDVGSYEAWLAQSRMRSTGTPSDSANASRVSALVASIDDFQYDWRRHKVPPKQIAQANPLQFMLLEAAEQALREADLLDREFDRRHTAVVVGSVFGGDFGNALFGGLRLPELRERLLQTLAEQGCGTEFSQTLADAYEVQFLRRYPALLDETGSFTSSTLASRLSKTYDLMGGAMAIDAGDTSSFAALNAACLLLHSGSINMVLCAAAQLACDRAALENLAQVGLLQRRGPAGECYAVGQGVALVLLKPLSAARRDGDQILGVVDALGVGFDASSLKTSIGLAASQVPLRQVLTTFRSRNTQPSLELTGGVGLADLDGQVSEALGLALKPSRNLPLTGFLHAAQGLVDLIGVTLDKSTAPQLIASHTPSGQSYVVCASAATASDHSPDTSTSKSHERAPELPVNQPRLHTANLGSLTPATASSNLGKLSTVDIYRVSAATPEDLKQQLAKVAAAPAEQASRCTANGFNLGQWRAAIVCEPGALAAQARKLSLLVGNLQSSATALEQGLLWSAPHDPALRPARVAWLFPGQGSQYTGMLFELCRSDTAAAAALKLANAALAELGQPSFDALAWDSPNQLGENVWHTQAAMLVADWIMLCTLRSRGLKADIVSGHSFGEFSAMLAAGCWDLPAALRATYERCRAIIEHVPPGCAMLSVQADATTVADTIAASGLLLSISHRNAPQQTVVGGRQSHIAQLAQLLDDEGLTSRLLPVPTAFHTSALQAAVQPFRAQLETIELLPPRTPLLSSVDNRFVAEPASIRDGLAQQLTAPLDFVALTERLVREGVTLALEVGPQQVLSRLVRQTSDQVCVVPTDHAKLGASYQLQIVAALCEMQGIMPVQNASAGSKSSGARSASVGMERDLGAGEDVAHLDSLTTRSVEPRSVEPQNRAVVHFDATAARRSRLRKAGQVPSHAATRWTDRPDAAAPQHFDATQARRQQQRHAAEHEVGQRSGTVGESAPLSANSTHSIEAFLIDFVVEQTGYPAEIIELDWDIEADLGIDSIKKAQLFGELREFFDLESHASIQLDDYRSLRDIAELLHSTPGKADWLNHDRESSGASDSSSRATDTFPGVAPRASATDQETLRSTDLSSAIRPSETQSASGVGQAAARHTASELSAFLVDFVVEQTGYPPEIVELDADLEADLGIDSIKKAQLFGELREMFAIDPAELATGKQGGAGESGRGGMDKFRTLRQILDALWTQQGAQPKAVLSIVPGGVQAPSGPQASSEPHLPSVTGGHVPYTPIAKKAAPSPERSTRELEGRLVEQQFDAEIDAGGQLPLWDSGNSAAGSPRAFATGLRANLRALVARRDAGPLAALPSNGSWSECQARIQQLSEVAAADPSSLQALERALLGQTRWQPILQRSAQTNVVWLADWLTPLWLSSHGSALGLKVNRSRQIELDALGSVSPLAVLTGTQLCVAGLYDLPTSDAGTDESCTSETV